MILAHNHQHLEIQEIADLLEDSLNLCFASIEVEDARYIVFYGVYKLGEACCTRY